MLKMWYFWGHNFTQYVTLFLQNLYQFSAHSILNLKWMNKGWNIIKAGNFLKGRGIGCPGGG